MMISRLLTCTLAAGVFGSTAFADDAIVAAFVDAARAERKALRQEASTRAAAWKFAVASSVTSYAKGDATLDETISPVIALMTSDRVDLLNDATSRLEDLSEGATGSLASADLDAVPNALQAGADEAWDEAIDILAAELARSDRRLAAVLRRFERKLERKAADVSLAMRIDIYEAPHHLHRIASPSSPGVATIDTRRPAITHLHTVAWRTAEQGLALELGFRTPNVIQLALSGVILLPTPIPDPNFSLHVSTGPLTGSPTGLEYFTTFSPAGDASIEVLAAAPSLRTLASDQRSIVRSFRTAARIQTKQFAKNGSATLMEFDDALSEVLAEAETSGDVATATHLAFDALGDARAALAAHHLTAIDESYAAIQGEIVDLAALDLPVPDTLRQASSGTGARFATRLARRAARLHQRASERMQQAFDEFAEIAAVGEEPYAVRAVLGQWRAPPLPTVHHSPSPADGRRFEPHVIDLFTTITGTSLEVEDVIDGAAVVAGDHVLDETLFLTVDTPASSLSIHDVPLTSGVGTTALPPLDAGPHNGHLVSTVTGSFSPGAVYIATPRF